MPEMIPGLVRVCRGFYLANHNREDRLPLWGVPAPIAARWADGNFVVYKFKTLRLTRLDGDDGVSKWGIGTSDLMIRFRTPSDKPSCLVVPTIFKIMQTLEELSGNINKELS